jgi:hypothetical protein
MKVLIDWMDCDLDVGLSYPGGEKYSKGYSCSLNKKVHELGLVRRETVRTLSTNDVDIDIFSYFST